MWFFVSSRRRHTICALVTWSSDVCSSDLARLYHHNRKFHELIYRAAHNRYLSKACIALHDVIATDRRGSHLVDPERCQAVIRDRTRVVQEKSVSVRVDLGGRRIIDKQSNRQQLAKTETL